LKEKKMLILIAPCTPGRGWDMEYDLRNANSGFRKKKIVTSYMA
jgi:hypothetical protein